MGEIKIKKTHTIIFLLSLNIMLLSSILQNTLCETNDLDDPVPSNDYKAFYECEDKDGEFTISLVYTTFTSDIFDTRARFKGDLDSTKEWRVIETTREMKNTSSTILWKYQLGSHDPFWIGSVSINDKIPISMNDQGDDIFNVTGEMQVKELGEWIDCWRLYNKTTDSELYYSKSNGLLISATKYNISNNINVWTIADKDQDDDDDDDSLTESIIPGYSIAILLSFMAVLTVYVLKNKKLYL